MPLPPLQYVLEAVSQDVLPAAGAGAFVLCLFLVFGRWAAALGSAVAFAVAFLAANFTLALLRFGEQPTWENTARLLPWKVAEGQAGWYWLPRAALSLLAVGLLSRWVGLLAGRLLVERLWWIANVLVWVPRIAAVFVVSEWLVAGKAAEAEQWQGLRWQLAGSMLAVWICLDSLARVGLSGQVMAYLAAMFLAAGAILLYTHNAKLMEVAVVCGCATFGIAVAAGVGKADASGAVPAGAVFLPGLMFATRPSLSANAVPPTAFWLVALAPLVLLPFLIPVLARKNGWQVRVIRAVLVLAPLVAAVVLAAQHEQLAFEEEW
jgi:hypothetical protein